MVQTRLVRYDYQVCPRSCLLTNYWRNVSYCSIAFHFKIWFCNSADKLGLYLADMTVRNVSFLILTCRMEIIRHSKVSWFLKSSNIFSKMFEGCRNKTFWSRKQLCTAISTANDIMCKINIKIYVSRYDDLSAVRKQQFWYDAHLDLKSHTSSFRTMQSSDYILGITITVCNRAVFAKIFIVDARKEKIELDCLG